MKELLTWCKGAVISTLVLMLQLFVLLFAGLGVYTATTFVVEINAESCADVTEHVSLCLVDDRALVKDTAMTL